MWKNMHDWIAREKQGCGHHYHKMQVLMKSSRCTLHLSAESARLGHWSSIMGLWNNRGPGKKRVSNTAKQRDNDLIHRRPRGQSSSSLRGCVESGESRRGWERQIEYCTSPRKGKPSQFFHLQYHHLLSGWHAASGMCGSTHLPKTFI